MRKDLADIFCTSADGVRGKKAVDWKLVDYIAPPSKFNDLIDERVSKVRSTVKLRDGKEGIKLISLNRNITNEGIQYDTVKAEINRDSRIANIHIIGPTVEAVSYTHLTLPTKA